MDNEIKLGVIGDPIDHSMSPYIHAQFAKAAGLKINYKPFHVVESDLNEFIEIYSVIFQILLVIFNLLIFIISLRENKKALNESNQNVQDIKVITH